MIQSKIGRDLTGTTIHENDQEAGEYHGQRIELGHPGYQYSSKSLSTCNGGGNSMVDTAYQTADLPVRTVHRTDSIVRMITFSTLIPTYFAVFSLSPTTEISYPCLL